MSPLNLKILYCSLTWSPNLSTDCKALPDWSSADFIILTLCYPPDWSWCFGCSSFCSPNTRRFLLPLSFHACCFLCLWYSCPVFVGPLHLNFNLTHAVRPPLSHTKRTYLRWQQAPKICQWILLLLVLLFWCFVIYYILFM